MVTINGTKLEKNANHSGSGVASAKRQKKKYSGFLFFWWNIFWGNRFIVLLFKF